NIIDYTSPVFCCMGNNMKEKIYQTILYSVVGCALAFSAFLLISDNVAPFTMPTILRHVYQPLLMIPAGSESSRKSELVLTFSN
ncbi:hypothetical protein QTN99_15095, partial [Photobacterium damselae]